MKRRECPSGPSRLWRVDRRGKLIHWLFSMSAKEARRDKQDIPSASPRYLGRDYGAHYYRRWWTKFTDFVFADSDFLALLQTQVEKSKLPPGSEFLAVKIGRTTKIVLRIPNDRFQDLHYSWRLNRRFRARDNGFASSKLRQARLADQDQYHTKADLRALWRIQKGRCYYTGAILGDSFDTAQFHVDHIDPLELGGHDGPTNLALVTALINTRKGRRSKRAFLKRWPLPGDLLEELVRIDRDRAAYFCETDRRKTTRPPRGGRDDQSCGEIVRGVLS